MPDPQQAFIVDVTKPLPAYPAITKQMEMGRRVQIVYDPRYPESPWTLMVHLPAGEFDLCSLSELGLARPCGGEPAADGPIHLRLVV